MNRIQSVTTALVLCGAAAVLGQNLITNPGFESSGSGWALVTDGTDTGSVSAVTYPDSGAHSGTRYARIEVTTPAVENWHIQFQTPAGWDAVNGGTYDMTFWAKSENSSSLHFSVQDGPNNGYTYRTGFDFALTPEWAEYTFSYTSDVEGNGALRFFLYVGSVADTYGFDDFNLTMTPPVGIQTGSPDNARQALRVVQGTGRLTLKLDGGHPENWTAELVDLRGASLSAAKGRADGSLHLALPRESGTYFVLAKTSGRTFIHKVTVR